MTPRGYLTIPEVLKIIERRIDDDDQMMQATPRPSKEEAACRSLASAILYGKIVEPYAVWGGAVHKVPEFGWIGGEDGDAEERRDVMEGWETWLPSGRVANKSSSPIHPSLRALGVAWRPGGRCACPKVWSAGETYRHAIGTGGT